MPVTVRKVRGVHRIVEVSTGHIAKQPSGKPMDGGHAHAKARGPVAAYSQMGHINEGIAEKNRHE